MTHWDDDRRLLAEMAVCEWYRIPHSEFKRWALEDQAKAVWYRSRQLSLCPSCGIPPEDAHEYVPDVRVYLCCQRRERAEDALGKRPPQERRGARVVQVKTEDIAEAE